MELRTGYKQTEVGVIPNDWFVRTIGEISIKIGSGITPTGGVKVYKQTGLPFIRSQNIGRGYLVLDDVAYIDQQIHATFSGSEIKADDVFLNITGASIGRSAIADERVQGGNVNQHVCIIRPSKNELNSKFLKSILLSDYGQRKIDSFQAGGNREGLNFSQIRSLIIPLPSLTEQVAIANALSDADALIQSLQKLITKKRQIKQGAMQTLLNPYENGVLKTGWDHKCLGDVLIVGHGRSQHEVVEPNGEFPILASGGEIGRANKFLYDKPSVLIGRKGTIDVPQYMDKPFWTIDTLFYTEILEPNIPKYLFYQFQMIDWYSYNEASGVPSLSARTIENIEIGIPSSEDQILITSILSDMDSEINALETKLAKYQQIKQGMMQNLLTGKIRLI